MDVVHERCAGLDVHKRTVVACLLTHASKGPVTLLCGCADPRRCHRTLLQKHLLDSAE